MPTALSLLGCTERGDEDISVYALDIEPEMIALIERKAQAEGLRNIRAQLRDFIAHGTGLPADWVDHAMIHNLLHLEDPVVLLAEARRVLKRGGSASIMHWRHDPAGEGGRVTFREQFLARASARVRDASGGNWQKRQRPQSGLSALRPSSVPPL